jgi:hypothetical protein
MKKNKRYANVGAKPKAEIKKMHQFATSIPNHTMLALGGEDKLKDFVRNSCYKEEERIHKNEFVNFIGREPAIENTDNGREYQSYYLTKEDEQYVVNVFFDRREADASASTDRGTFEMKEEIKTFSNIESILRPDGIDYHPDKDVVDILVKYLDL